MQVIARIMSLLNATPQADAQVSADGAGFSLDDPSGAPQPPDGFTVAASSGSPIMARSAFGLVQNSARNILAGVVSVELPDAADVLVPETSGTIQLDMPSLSSADAVEPGAAGQGGPLMSETTGAVTEVLTDEIIAMSGADATSVEANEPPVQAVAPRERVPVARGVADQPTARTLRPPPDTANGPAEPDPAWPAVDDVAVSPDAEEGNAPVVAEEPVAPAALSAAMAQAQPETALLSPVAAVAAPMAEDGQAAFVGRPARVAPADANGAVGAAADSGQASIIKPAQVASVEVNTIVGAAADVAASRRPPTAHLPARAMPGVADEPTNRLAHAQGADSPSGRTGSPQADGAEVGAVSEAGLARQLTAPTGMGALRDFAPVPDPDSVGAPTRGADAERAEAPVTLAGGDGEGAPAPSFDVSAGRMRVALADADRNGLATSPSGQATETPAAIEATKKTAEVLRYPATPRDGGQPVDAHQAATPTATAETDAQQAVAPRPVGGAPTAAPNGTAALSEPDTEAAPSTRLGKANPEGVDGHPVGSPEGQVRAADGALRQMMTPSQTNVGASIAAVAAAPGGSDQHDPDGEASRTGELLSAREAMGSAKVADGSLSQDPRATGTVTAAASDTAMRADPGMRRAASAEDLSAVGAAAHVEAPAPHTESRAHVTAPSGPPSADPATVAMNARLIAEAIALGSGRERVEVRLDPPELGRVSIDMAVDGGTVSAIVSADRPETLDLLRRHVDTLQRELSASGFGRADIGFADKGGGGQAQGGGSTATPADAAPGPAPQPMPRTMPRTLDASGRLDIRL